MGKWSFYFLWVIQLFAHLSFLLFGITYFILASVKLEGEAAPEVFGLGFVFIILFILQQRSKNNIRGLMRDRKDFERGWWTVNGRMFEINKRYSLRKKHEIPEMKVRKGLYKRLESKI